MVCSVVFAFILVISLIKQSWTLLHHCSPLCQTVCSQVILCTSPPCSFVCQDVCQYLEKLKGTLLSLSAGARRLSDKEQAEKTVTELNTSYEQSIEEAKDKQSSLENLLSLWQK